MKKICLSCLSLLFLAFLIVIPTTVSAQEILVNSENVEVLVQEPSVAPKLSDEEIENERVRLRGVYKEQILQYQTAYRQFSLTKADFKKLDTLASLEKAIIATREAYRSRNELLLTYIDQLLLELYHTPSFEQATTSEYVNRFLQLKIEVGRYNQLVINSQDRQALRERADGFIPIAKEIQELSHKARIQLLLGKLRSSSGLAQQITQEVKDAHASNPVSATKQAERQRAYQELTAADAAVEEAWTNSLTELGKIKVYSADTYATFIATLNPIQSRLLRWYSLLDQASQL